MELKRQKFSQSLLARHLYTRQLACPISQLLSGTEQKDDQFSRLKFYIMQGQTIAVFTPENLETSLKLAPPKLAPTSVNQSDGTKK